jgi:hypothetical protein
MEPKLSGILQLLAYADEVILLGDNMDTVKKITRTLIDASKEVDLEMNIEKTKYMLLSCHRSTDQNQDRKIAKGLFENVLQVRCLRMTLRNQNLLQKDIEKRLNSGNGCYHSVQNILSPHLLSKH